MAKKDKVKDESEPEIDSKITNYIRASYPILWLQTHEESRAEREIFGVAKLLKRRLKVWSCTEGFRELGTMEQTACEDPIEALNTINTDTETSIIYVFRDLHVFFNVPRVLRLLRDISRDFKQGKKTLILLSPTSDIPIELERDIVMIDFKLPERDLVAQIFDSIYEQNEEIIKKDNGEIDSDERELIIQAALGLTTGEVENAISKAIVDRAKMDVPNDEKPSISKLVMSEKAQSVRKTGILEYFEAPEQTSDIGGLENLKLWFNIRKNAFTIKAREFGLPMPRGIMLVGLPGCGKSLSAKAASNALGVPLIRFDIGRVFGGLVGQSEQNMRSAIGTIEAIGNCVVWIDEMEKAFAGAGGSGNSDSGVTQRIFGNFITWMQEKKSPSFIVATVNRIESLPPELLRKGRFDEIFFVGLPGPTEREAILKIHITKKKRDIKNFKLQDCITESAGFSGAELEEAVVTGLYTAFYKDDELKDKYILKAIKETTPLSKSAKSSLEAMEKWASDNAVNASKLDILEKQLGSGAGRQIEF